jgi:hypothetical protein
MRFAAMIVAAGIGLGGNAPAQAEQAGWTEAQSLRELPAGLQALLGVGLGLAGIADRGEKFNETDAGDDSMPRRRFVLGVVHGDTAMVALEQGGRMYAVRAVEFRQAGATWDAVRCAPMDAVPRRGAELVGVLSGRTAGPCGGVGIRMDPAPAPALPARVRPRPGA